MANKTITDYDVLTNLQYDDKFLVARLSESVYYSMPWSVIANKFDLKATKVFNTLVDTFGLAKVNDEGIVTSVKVLEASDIPDLSMSQITDLTATLANKVDNDFASAINNLVVGKVEYNVPANTHANIETTYINPATGNTILKVQRLGSSDRSIVYEQTSDGHILLSVSSNLQLQADWNEESDTAHSYIKNKPNLATVATTGDYNDLSNKIELENGDPATLALVKDPNSNKYTFTVLGGMWGSIGGDINDQTDLMTRFSRYYTANQVDELIGSIETSPLQVKGYISAVDPSTLRTLSDGSYWLASASTSAPSFQQFMCYRYTEEESGQGTWVQTIYSANDFNVWVNINGSEDNSFFWLGSKWEQLDFTVDLSNYYTKSNVDTLLLGKQDTLTAGTNISITNNVISTSVPVATTTVTGITKLYDTLGTNTDGAVAQYKVKEALDKKQDKLTAGTDLAIVYDSGTDTTTINFTNATGYATRAELNTKQNKLTAGTDLEIINVPNTYTQYDYIEADGTQYLDTGISVSSIYDYEISLTINDTDLSGNPGLFFGGRTNADNKGIILGFDLVGGFISDYLSSSRWTAGNILTVNVPYKFVLGKSTGSMLNRRSLFIYNETTGNEIANHLYSGQTRTDTETALIFGARSEGIAYPFQKHLQIRSVKLYDSQHNLIRNYIPVTDSQNVPGMYDTITGAFITNQGTGNLIVGNVVPNTSIINFTNTTGYATRTDLSQYQQILNGQSGDVLVYTGIQGVITSATLASVATSGDYNDLINKPLTLGAKYELIYSDYDTVNHIYTFSDPLTIYTPTYNFEVFWNGILLRNFYDCLVSVDGIYYTSIDFVISGTLNNLFVSTRYYTDLVDVSVRETQTDWTITLEEDVYDNPMNLQIASDSTNHELTIIENSSTTITLSTVTNTSSVADFGAHMIYYSGKKFKIVAISGTPDEHVIGEKTMSKLYLFNNSYPGPTDYDDVFTVKIY